MTADRRFLLYAVYHKLQHQKVINYTTLWTKSSGTNIEPIVIFKNVFRCPAKLFVSSTNYKYVWSFCHFTGFLKLALSVDGMKSLGIAD